MIFGATLRALGHQKVGAYLNVSGYTLIAIPLGLYLCFFKDLGMYGLWIGLAVGLIFVVLSDSLYIICFVDWEQECEE